MFLFLYKYHWSGIPNFKCCYCH